MLYANVVKGSCKTEKTDKIALLSQNDRRTSQK